MHPSPITAVLPLLLLGGCLSVEGAVEPAGAPDTFTVTERVSPVAGGARAAARLAQDSAAAFCAGRGRVMRAVNSEVGGWPIQQDIVGPTANTLTFRCLAPDDPSVQQLNPGTAS
jgi:hypothetical protein